MSGVFRRAIVIEPEPGKVHVRVEDDMHHMRVMLHHDDRRITGIDGEMIRAPWTTCPGAVAVLHETFVGSTLADAARVGSKKRNCTHLFDLAVLGAAHAGEIEPVRYDLSVTDPVDGKRELTGMRNGKTTMQWTDKNRMFSSPEEIADRNIFEIGAWIASLSKPQAELARALRTASVISHGRTIPMENQSDATRIPANCFTFQPGRKEKAERVRNLRDFTRAMDGPLAGT